MTITKSNTALFICLFLWTLCCRAENISSPLTTTTGDAQSQIQNIQTDLAQQREMRTQLHQQLQQAKVRLTQLEDAQKKTAQLQQTQQGLLQPLQQTLANLHKISAIQQIAFAKNLCSMYPLMQDADWRIAADNQERIAHNHEWMNGQSLLQSQVIVLDKLTILMQKNEADIQALQQHFSQFSVSPVAQKNQLAALTAQTVADQTTLDQLEENIQSKDEILGELLADDSALEQVVQAVSRTSQVEQMDHEALPPLSPTAPKPAVTLKRSFESYQGKLPWPTEGLLIGRFNSHIDQTNIKLKGIFIRAQKGQVVHVVASGKVAFAGFMSGYGLLMIVDHGEGYMTLYGQNNSLSKGIGDMVTQGEAIATVGDAAEYATSGLYFAIRQHGHAVDPLHWMHHS